MSVAWSVLRGPHELCPIADIDSYWRNVANANLIQVQGLPGESDAKAWSMPLMQSLYPLLKLARAQKESSPSSLMDQPIIERKAPHPSSDQMTAILISRDGGWASLDLDLAEALNQRGVSTVGLDAMRYFCKSQTPDSTTKDLQRIISLYGQKWSAQHFILIGYSRGADVLPFLVNRLTTDQRSRISTIELISPARRSSFQFHIRDWFSFKPQEKDLPLLPEMAKLTDIPLVCVYGEDEKADSLSPTLMKGQATIVSLPGGHRLNGNYQVLVDDLLNRHTTATE